jgi:cytochrome P450
MPRKLSANSAADQITTLITAGHYKTPEAAAKALPELAHGLDEYKKRQEARKPVGSGSALLSR